MDLTSVATGEVTKDGPAAGSLIELGAKPVSVVSPIRVCEAQGFGAQRGTAAVPIRPNHAGIQATGGSRKGGESAAVK